MADRALVELARNGDHEAFATLVRAAAVRLDGAARLILRDPELARDAVQEALIRAWRDLSALRDLNGSIPGSTADLLVQAAWPLWSPDGTKIATQRWRNSGSAWLAVAAVDGGAGFDVALETPFREHMGWAAVWSPDGTRLLAFWDEVVGGIWVDAATGEFERREWPLTDRPSWQRVAP